MRTLASLRLPRLVLLLALALSAGLLGGCYTEGGPGFSADQHTYVSRPWQPWTITLRDTRTGQEFWSMDVPVGKKLVIKFVEGEGTADKYTPDQMKWALVDESRDSDVSFTNTLACPPWNSRRLEPTLRTAPELPPSMVTATKGTLQPQKVQQVRPPQVTIPAPPPPETPGADTPPPSDSPR